MDRVDRLRSNLTAIKQRIADACRSVGREPSEIRLVCVTKYVGAETTGDLVQAGAEIIGESRPQVFKEKFEKLSDLDVQWHLIGHLQRNKIKFVLPHAALIHSVDSLRLIEAIDAEAEKKNLDANILLEVNISGEEAKHGFQPKDLPHALEAVQQSKRIRTHGLMGMSRWGGTEDEARREFESLRKLREGSMTLQSERVDLRELSMGMTGDFEIAIEQGATMVRIGSALFEGVSE